MGGRSANQRLTSTTTDGPAAAPPPGLRRVITLPWLILYGVGSTVGAGIYVLTGVVAGRAGLLAPVSFLLASLIALLTALSFAELSARFPRAGGALVYVREGTGSAWLSTLVGLMTASAGVVSAATVSVGFTGYLEPFVGGPTPFWLLLFVGTLGALVAWGVKESVVAAGLITLVEVAGLAAILVFGGARLATTLPASLPLPNALPESGSVWAAVSSAVLCFYAFLGFEDMVNVAEEVREAPVTLPRAILWTIGLSTALYLGVTTVSVLLVPPEELGRSDAPLALVFERAGGPGFLLSLAALVAMVNGALIQLVMASRILYSLAHEGPLPAWLGWIHPRTRTPLCATGLVTAAVAILALRYRLESLAETTALVALAVFALVNGSLVLLRLSESTDDQTEGDQDEPGAKAAKTPLWIPIAGVLAALAFLSIDLIERIGR